MDIAAFFNIAINSNDELLITSDFLDESEEAMAKLVFLLCSGTLMEIVGNIVAQRCVDDIDQRNRILSQAYNMILENMADMLTDDPDWGDVKSLNDDDDETPLVDPCFVFRPSMEEEDDEDTR